MHPMAPRKWLNWHISSFISIHPLVIRIRTLTSGPGDFQPLYPNELMDGMSYSNAAHYMQPQYYPTSHVPTNVHIVPPMPREDNAQRKRPKYTRSKTGCLTCRIKKIKCDESKPICTRCKHGQRDCTWPEGVPVNRNSTSREHPTDDFDGRPSTAESSGLSDTSTPPTRDHTPPNGLRLPLDMGLPPLVSRRQSEPFLQMNQMAQQRGLGRRQSVDPNSTMQNSPIHRSPSNTGSVSMIPESSSCPSVAHGYLNAVHPIAHPAPRRGALTNQHIGDRFIPHAASSTQWNPSIPPSLDPIEPFFQTAQERNLIRHYCDNSLSIIMAVPSENPIVAANLPLVLSRPLGSDSSTEALRTALMGVAAIHQSYLLARGGATPDGAEEMMLIAQQYRMNSKKHLMKACSTVEGTRSDASLAAALAITLMDIFSGGRNWSKNMDLAKNLVRLRGGPGALLARSTPGNPGVVDGISRSRLFLDILAVYDVAGCLTSGRTPMILDPSQDNWWLDPLYVSYSWVESVFGFSCALLSLLARLTSFVSRFSRMKEQTADMDQDTNPESLKECHELYNSLESWMQRSPGLPSRVHSGNTIYAKAAQILLLREILEVDPTDSTVQQCARTVLDLCLQCTARKMGVDLIWPVIIAGSHIYGADRTLVTEIFEAFRTQCCYEVDTSEEIVQRVWKRRDQGHPRPEWRQVIMDLDLRPLLI